MNTKKIVILLLVLTVGAAAFFIFSADGGEPAIRSFKKFLAGVFFIDSVTETGLKEKSAAAQNDGDKVKILVVPGHDNDYWGTEFKGLREADLTLQVSEALVKLLKNEKAFEVYTTRTSAGYIPEFSSYFATEREAIKKFRGANFGTMDSAVRGGIVHRKSGVSHVYAKEEVGIRLWGINKWANEHNIDIVIHLHFNDYGGRLSGQRGGYSGFAVYAPETQFSNSKASIAVAQSIVSQFDKYFAKSNFPKEDSGVVEDQDLIAVGANNSLDAAGLLIEYGYIYEPQFTNSDLRPAMLKELAMQTYFGITNFFGASQQTTYNTSLLPHLWSSNLEKQTANSDVLALQAALIAERLWPPAGFNQQNCPLNGKFGDCTQTAVRAFQEKYGLNGRGDYVGELTRVKLNERYSK